MIHPVIHLSLVCFVVFKVKTLRGMINVQQHFCERHPGFYSLKIFLRVVVLAMCHTPVV
jgi:hypothetical protein